ncbi:MAG TPA: isomerase [Gammaproteobacteria bacterium]|nr:isomerase [Gammaproteobacteria bacterium]
MAAFLHRHRLLAALLAAMIALAACAVKQPDLIREQARVDYDLLLTLPEQPVDYRHRVKPVLERRCIVCHGCYDAPCQLKLSSFDGITRGASPVKVYDGTRILGSEPTRLGIDARTTAEWRNKGFHTVLNEGEATPRENLEQSVLYQLLRLKQLHPQARVGMLSADFDLALDREQVCPKREEFQAYADRHPLWGMPYAMPNLSDTEYKTLVQWLAQGSPVPAPAAPSPQAAQQIAQWEPFFNADGNKEKLVSRYLYEHLFQAHIHFAGTPPREFYRLVRSFTPPGQAIDEIPTVRPYDDPGTASFYYRLRPYRASIVAKNHVVYELSPQKMARYRQLFLEPDYPVDQLPPYQLDVASNPFRVFEAIPPDARYRFLLDDARFFIEGFVKGPVCRGQIALNVIEDQFWVFFFDPDHNLVTADPEFLNSVSGDLDMPSERGDTLRLFAAWTEYWGKLNGYMNAKQAFFQKLPQQDLEQALRFIWDGDGNNPNAALTVFRHFDSASVSFGLAGDYPETAWVIDYPLLERIHYLLVAGFNVYGNVGHQLNTRLYMDFLRMEGEDYFLAFLPVSQRKQIRDSWYAGIRADLEKYLHAPSKWLETEVVTGYRSNDPQTELYRRIQQRLGRLAETPGELGHCQSQPCEPGGNESAVQRADRAMLQVAAIQGRKLEVFPDLTFVRIRSDSPTEQGLAYTLIHNKAYKNISSMFSTEAGRELDDRRDLEHDTMTVVRGLQGAYPNFFFDIELAQVEDFAERYANIETRKDYERFVGLFGVRRTRYDFWDTADWLQDHYAAQQPVDSGLFDLNRYRNR